MIVGAEAMNCMQIAQLCHRGHAVGRLSVDVAVDPVVDARSIGLWIDCFSPHEWQEGYHYERLITLHRNLCTYACKYAMVKEPISAVVCAESIVSTPCERKPSSQITRDGAQ